MQKLARSLATFVLGSALISGACEGSDAAPTPPPDYAVTITHLDQVAFVELNELGEVELDQDERPKKTAASGDVTLQCDGTLAVKAFVSPQTQFALRAANNCGESSRCGYLHIEGLAQDGQVLASVDTATDSGVLRLDIDQQPQLSKIRAVLMRGIDSTPVTNADRERVEDVLTPSLVVRSDCAPPASSEGGAGGGGAVEPEPNQAGAGGSEPDPEPLGGAGGVAGGAGGTDSGGATPGGAGAGS